jgi:hypothetical protein
MSVCRKTRACTLAGCATISLIGFSASARAEVLFNSLDSPTTGVFQQFVGVFEEAASFATGASSFHATDIALLLNQSATILPGDTFTVSLEGGVPLADLVFNEELGLLDNNGDSVSGPVLGSITLPISDLSTSLAVENFKQFGSIPLKPNSFYWVALSVSGPASADGPVVGWGVTSDNSGIGVAAGYSSSDFTDFFFFPNNGAGGGPAFQMEVSGTAVPEPSTWGLLLLGFGGRRSRLKAPGDFGARSLSPEAFRRDRPSEAGIEREPNIGSYGVSC